MDLRGVSTVWLLCIGQCLIAIVGALVAWAFAGAQAAGAALFGGAVVVLPALWFARRALSQPGALEAKQVLGAFYRAELEKLALTVLLFFIAALAFGKHYAALMLTCVACLAMNWVMLAVTANRKGMNGQASRHG